MIRVVVTDANLARVGDELGRLLAGHAELVWALDQDEQMAALAEADVLVGPAFSVAMAEAAPALRLVQVGGAGTDQIDPAAIRRHHELFGGRGARLQVANTFHHEAAMAEYAIWAAVGLRRELARADHALRLGTWRSPVYDPALPLPPGLAGARVVLLGFGHVGQAAWNAFRALGASGIAITGSGSVNAAEHGLTWAAGSDRLVEACAESDVLLVSVPLSERTRGVVGDEVLEALGSAGIVINLARGPVVDAEALYRRLSDGQLGGAALDVWYRYPSAPGEVCAPSEENFAALPNVLLTPHISGVALQTFLGRAGDIAHNVRALGEERPLINTVTL